MSSPFRGARRALPVAALLLSAIAGCGSGLHPVRGKVTLDDGKPLTKGLVIFEGKQGEKTVMARGVIQTDGSYRLSTHTPGDGAPPGKYRVLIAPMEDVDAPDNERRLAFDSRYTDFNTSGLEFEVQAGDNDIPIRLARAGKPRP
ncbi:MAG: hypothetical protein L0Z62_02845 [Gemmataceae bacterium]|nr:hypothetical protein [Gemmataceae bacterium]